MINNINIFILTIQCIKVIIILSTEYIYRDKITLQRNPNF